jgi:zinc protease
MTSLTRLAILVAGCAFPAFAAVAQEAAAPEVPASEIPVIGANIESFTLDNGLEVVVIPDHRAPIVTHMIWYRVGSADEPEGHTGIAHFLEHLMFKGTTTHPGAEFSRVVSEIGGEENAFTSDDYTGYYQRVAREELGRMMEYEADRMENLVLTPEVIDPERRVVLEERSMRIENDPGAILQTAMDATLFLRHPYGVPVIGWRDEIEALDDEDAIAFYDRFYTPNNAVLVVAGDITTEEVRTLAERTYGQVERRAEPPPRERPQAERLDVPRDVTLRDARVDQPVIQTVWLTPSYNTDEDGEAESLALLSEILGGGTTSRLYEALVVEQKIAVSAGASYQGSALDPDKFGVYAVPNDGVTLDELAAAMAAIIEEVKAEGVTAAEIELARNQLFAQVVYASDNQVSLVHLFGGGLTTGLTVEEIRNWPAALAEVTPEDVQAVAQRYLLPETSVTGRLLPAAEPTPN